MKRIIRLLFALALLLPLASCEELGGNLSKDDLVGTWRAEKILINDERVDFPMTITLSQDGSGYMMDDTHEIFQYQLDGNRLSVRPGNSEDSFDFTVEIKNDDELILKGKVIPGTGEDAKFEGHFRRVGGNNSGDNGGNNGGNNGGDNGVDASGDGSYSDENITISPMSDPVWEYDGNNYYVNYVWFFRINNKDLASNIFTEDGRDYTYGIGYYPVGKENVPPRYFNGNDQNMDTHEQIDATDNGHQIYIHSRIKTSNDKTARPYVYLSTREKQGNGLIGGDFYYGSTFTIKFDPDAAGNVNQNIGVSMPEQDSHTATSITLKSTFTGSYTSSEPFREATCGFLLCPQDEGAPQWGQSRTIDCTQSAWDNDGRFFAGTFDNLEEGKNYNVCSWLVLKPGDQPSLSDWRTVGTKSGNNNNNNVDFADWARIDKISVGDDGTSIQVTVTGYFDTENPIGIGVCYGTDGEPTVEGTKYNAFEHIVDFENMEYDDTILSMNDNTDGSKTVTAVIKGLLPGTTYFLRAYIQWASDEVHPVYYSKAEPITTSNPQ